jgi:hypothetical protein
MVHMDPSMFADPKRLTRLLSYLYICMCMCLPLTYVRLSRNGASPRLRVVFMLSSVVYDIQDMVMLTTMALRPTELMPRQSIG